MDDEMKKLKETVHFIQKMYSQKPRVGVVLGSGLGKFKDEIRIEKEIHYVDIPNFPVVTVEGHHGKLVFGMVAGKRIVAMAGRFHYYEGYSTQEVIFPIRVMKLLGVETLLISNAAGGVDPSLRVGDLMIITDHISIDTHNPLIGKNINELGPRFPDMSEPYKKTLIEKAKQIAGRLNITVKEGIYFGVTGPTFETRSEYKMIHILGGDAVGMSTVQEVIAANHMNLPVFAMSVITDVGIREEENTITHDDVLEAAIDAGPGFSALFRELIAEI